MSPPTPRPLYATRRDYRRPTHGPLVGRVAALLGKPLMPWQQLVADVALELNKDGIGYRYPRVLITVPRQAGKTTLMHSVTVHRMLTVPGGGRAWWTAQTRNDVRDHFLPLAERISETRGFTHALIRKANGSEGLTLPNRGSLRIFAPAENAIHGKSADLLFLDEIWAFLLEQGRALMQGALPTMLTRPWAQTWQVSTAGNARSTYMRPLVTACRAELDQKAVTDTAYFEWGVPEDRDPMDLATVAAFHPAFGHTIRNRRALAYDPKLMTAGEYARAYANQWVSADTFYVAPAIWERARTAEPFAPGSPVSFALEVTPDRSGTVIAAAGYTADGALAVEVVEYRSGMAWGTGRMIELIRRHRPVAVVVDPYGPARPVHKDLTEQRHTMCPMAEVTAADIVAADAEFVSGLVERTTLHRSSERLDAALACATTRSVREQTVISRAGDDAGNFPAALVAAMLAAYGLRHPPAVAPRPDIRTSGE